MALYDAFVSYSHAKDKPIAAALQSTVQKLGKPWYRRRALRVFRDDSSLSATPHLWPAIEDALAQSRYFILLASPEAASSKWVNKEVAYWLDHKSIDTLLIGVTDGTLGWDDTAGDFSAQATSPLPPVLTRRFQTEPKWVDLTAYRAGAAANNADFTSLAADFAAAIREMPKEDLLSQEVRQQRRALALAWSAAAALLVFAGAAGWQGWLAMQNADRAEKNASEATRQRNVALTNERTAKEQRDQALLTQSRFLTDLAQQALAAHDYTTALLLSLEALPDQTSADEPARARPYWAPAEVSLETARRSLRELLVIDGHSGTITSVAMTPDGSRVVTSSYDETVRIWDGKTGAQVGQIKGDTSHVESVAITSDGSRIVTGSSTKGARIWDAGTGREIVALEAPPEALAAVAITRDGARVVTAGNDQKVRVWDGRTGRQLLEFPHEPRVTSIAVTADGSRIVGNAENDAQVWDANSGAELIRLKGHTEDIVSVAVTADGARIVTGSNDNTARIWDGTMGAELAVLKGHERTVSGVAIADDGEHVVTGSYDNTVRIWDGKTGAELAVAKAHKSGIFGVAMTSDGSRFASGGGSDVAGPVKNDQLLRIWDGNVAGAVLKGHNGAVTSVAVTPNGRRIITGSKDNTARIWDAKTGTAVAVLEGHADAITAIAVTPDGTRAITGSRDNTARIWDLSTGKELIVLKGHDTDVSGVAGMPDGKSVVTGSADGTIRVWDIGNGSVVKVLKSTGPIGRLAVTPDGKSVVVSSGPGARVLDLTTGEELARLQGHTNSITAMAVTPDGTRVITGSIDQTARLWDIKTGAELVRLEIKAQVNSVAVTPDGARVIIASQVQYLPGKAVGIWDLRTRAEVAEFSGHGADVNAVAVTSDGRRAVSGSNDETAQVWEIFPAGHELIKQAKALAPRCLDPEERERYFLTSTPPRWCATAQRWPYDAVTVAVTRAEDNMRAKRWREAIAAFETAISQDPHAQARLASRMASAHDEIAWAAFLDVELGGKPVGLLKDALRDSEQAVALVPDNETFLDTRGKIYQALGRTDEALADLDRAIALGINGVGTLYARGRVNELKGNLTAAISDYRKAIDLDARNESYPTHAQGQARARLDALGSVAGSDLAGSK
jgi:WD40 repeat protein